MGKEFAEQTGKEQIITDFADNGRMESTYSGHELALYPDLNGGDFP